MCIVLPLLCRPEEQEQALLDGLEEVCSILCRFAVFERLYAKDKQTSAGMTTPDDTTQLEEQFKKAAVKLLGNRTEFQARSACQCSRNSVFRYLRDVFRTDDWSALMGRMRRVDAYCTKYVQTLHASEFDQGMDAQSHQLEPVTNSASSLIFLGGEALVKYVQAFRPKRSVTSTLKSVNAWTSYERQITNLTSKRFPKECQKPASGPRTIKSIRSSNRMTLRTSPGSLPTLVVGDRSLHAT